MSGMELPDPVRLMGLSMQGTMDVALPDRRSVTISAGDEGSLGRVPCVVRAATKEGLVLEALDPWPGRFQAGKARLKLDGHTRPFPGRIVGRFGVFLSFVPRGLK